MQGQVSHEQMGKWKRAQAVVKVGPKDRAWSCVEGWGCGRGMVGAVDG